MKTIFDNENKKCGVELARIKSTSDESIYHIYIPDIQTIVMNQSEYKMRKEVIKDEVHLYIPVQTLINWINNDRTLMLYEIISACVENQCEYIDNFFMGKLDTLMYRENLFSIKVLEQIVNQFKDDVDAINSISDIKERMKVAGNVYSKMYEILELSKKGIIYLPLKEHDLIDKIRNDEEFFTVNEKKIKENMINFYKIMDTAIKTNDDGIKDIPKEFGSENLNDTLNSMIVDLVKTYCF